MHSLWWRMGALLNLKPQEYIGSDMKYVSLSVLLVLFSVCSVAGTYCNILWTIDHGSDGKCFIVVMYV